MLYIGELDSEATKLSLPILNEAGVPEIGPAGTYVGLTTHEPGAAPGEPAKYQPAGSRTFLRIVPRDSVEAAAALEAMKQAGCQRVAVAHDTEPYGIGLADELVALQRSFGLRIVHSTTVGANRRNLHAYATSLRAQNVHCFELRPPGRRGLPGRISVLGTYQFDSGGDTTLAPYGLYTVAAGGDRQYYKRLTPSSVPPGS